MNKNIKILVLALMLITTPAIADDKIEIRGTVYTVDTDNIKKPTWDAQSFAGFYYDIKSDISSEIMSIDRTVNSLQSSKTISEGELTYTTQPIEVLFKSYEKESVLTEGKSTYSIMGWQAEKWVALNGKPNKIAKLIYEMNKDDKITLKPGETWSLGNGYTLRINAIDARTTPRQVWVTLKKDDKIIDEGIAQAPGSSKIIDKQKAVYTSTKTILGESDTLLFSVYVDTIFSGTASDMVQFKYAWLIDENTAKEIKSGDKFGVFEVTSTGDSIVLENTNTVSLSPNNDVTLMGNMKFKVADNSNLRFYPYVEHIEPGTYEIRGKVTDSVYTWDAQSFAGFFYDIKNNQKTETLQTEVIIAKALPAGRLIYETSPVDVEYKSFSSRGIKVDEKSTYSVIGWQAEKWIALNDKANKIAKLTYEMDKDDKITLKPNAVWNLGNDYTLVINAIDARTTPRQVWVTFRKGDIIIDEGVIQSSGTKMEDKEKAVYTVTRTILGDSDVLMFSVYVDTIFSGTQSDMVQFKYAWLIDENTAKEIKTSDTFGVFEVTRSDSDKLKLKNKNSVSLSKNSETTLMGNMKFKVADSDTLRYYPMVEVNVGNEEVKPIITPNVTKPTPKVTNIKDNGTATITGESTHTKTTTPIETPETGDISGSTTDETETPSTPGFGIIFGILGLLFVVRLSRY